VNRALSERYHAEIEDRWVTAWNGALMRFELAARASRLSGWPLILARNRWFQRKVVAALAECSKPDRGLPLSCDPAPVLFSYSYAALEPFRWAKARGWHTVLGQIDPGLTEERILRKLHAEWHGLQPDWQPAPAEYWEHWQEETHLADRIIVNSPWACAALESEGIARAKIGVVPLAYAPPQEARLFRRGYPRGFSRQRPLQVLFLGQLNLRKGMAAVLESVRLLSQEPVEFRFVGPQQLTVPADVRNKVSVTWTGPLTRGEVSSMYRWADVFLFPTFSDGFGLTQLEAQAWKLPVIASPYCGDVVRDGVNGLRLKEVSGQSIAAALRRLLDEPGLLPSLAKNSRVGPEFSLDALGASLQDAITEANRTLPIRPRSADSIHGADCPTSPVGL
jgi:glycosyltransferase involved in cell wall biosynthesis